jgi:hypothetical protein
MVNSLRGLAVAGLICSFVLSTIPAFAKSQPTSTPPKVSGLSLNLSSFTPSIAANFSSLLKQALTTINIGGQKQTIQYGQMLTPAEYVALSQVASGHSQSLNLNSAGQAVSGSFRLNTPALGSSLSQLVIPQGVIAIDPASRTALDVTGTLSDSGTLVGLGSNRNNTVTIDAGSINVSGTLTSKLSTSLANAIGLAGAGNFAPVSLSLNSLSDLVNSGTISASGTLSLQAAGGITNQALSGTKAMLSGAQGVNIYAGSGQIVNGGTIVAGLSDVNFNTASGVNLSVNNAGGLISASNGAVNLRAPSYSASDLTQLLGGDIAANSLNLFGGNGASKIDVNSINGVVNVTAGTGAVNVAEGALDISNMNLSGDPTIANSNGNVVLSGSIATKGGDLAILASQEVLTSSSSAISINLSSTSGDSGNLTIVAGFDFTPTTGTGSGTQVTDPIGNATPTTYTLTGPSGSAGNVLLSNVALITTASTSSFNGGYVSILAHGGQVFLSSINTSSKGGSGGDVSIVAQNGLQIGATPTSTVSTSVSINTSGTSAGAVSITGAEATISAATQSNNINFIDGTQGGTAVFLVGTPQAGAGASIVLNGGINAAATKTVGGDVDLETDASVLVGGAITTSGGTTSGGLTMSTLSQNIAVNGNIITAGLAPTTGPAGAGGDVQVTSGSAINFGGNVVASGKSGGDLTLSTSQVNPADPSSAYTGSIVIGGYVDLRGTFAKGGDAQLQAATVQIMGANTAAQNSSLIASGSGGNGTILINTYGVQVFPSNLNLTSSTPSVIVDPGAVFTVGNTTANGSKGSIISGTIVANSTNAGLVTIASPFIAPNPTNPTVQIVPLAATADSISINGAAAAPLSPNSGTTRVLVTPAEAVALYQVTHGQTQSIWITSSGAAADSNPNVAGQLSSFSADAADLPKAFTAFDLDTAGPNHTVTMTVTGDAAVLNLPTATTAQANTIAGTLSFQSQGTLNFGANALNITSTGSVTAADALTFQGSPTSWTIAGAVTSPTINMNFTTGTAHTVVLASTASFTSGTSGVAADLMVSSAGTSTVTFTGSSQGSGTLDTSISVPTGNIGLTLKINSVNFGPNAELGSMNIVALNVSSSGDLSIAPNANITTKGAFTLLSGGGIEFGDGSLVKAGSVSVSASDDVTADVNAGVIANGVATFTAGGDFDVDGGNTFAGSTSLTINAANELTESAGDNNYSSTGGSVTIIGGKGVTFGTGSSISAKSNVSLQSGGDLDLGDNSTVSGGVGVQLSEVNNGTGDFEVHDGASLTAGTGAVGISNSGGDVTFDDGAKISAGTLINITSGSFTDTSNGEYTAKSTITISASSSNGGEGSIDLGDSSTFTSEGNLIFLATDDIDIGGTTMQSKNGQLSVTTSGGDISLAGGATFQSVNSMTFSGNNIEETGNSNTYTTTSATAGTIAFNATKGIQLVSGTTFHAGYNLNLDAAGGDLEIADPVTMTAGGALSLTASGEITLAGADHFTSVKALDLTANEISETVGDTYAATSATLGTVVFTATEDIKIAASTTITAGNSMELKSQSGDIDLGMGAKLIAGTTMLINALGDFSLAGAAQLQSANSMQIVANEIDDTGSGSSFTATSKTAGSISFTAAADLGIGSSATITAGTTLSLLGSSIGSGDVEIGDQATLTSSGNMMISTLVGGKITINQQATLTITGAGNMTIQANGADTTTDPAIGVENTATINSGKGNMTFTANAGSITVAYGANFTSGGNMSFTAGGPDNVVRESQPTVALALGDASASGPGASFTSGGTFTATTSNNNGSIEIGSENCAVTITAKQDIFLKAGDNLTVGGSGVTTTMTSSASYIQFQALVGNLEYTSLKATAPNYIDFYGAGNLDDEGGSNLHSTANDIYLTAGFIESTTSEPSGISELTIGASSVLNAQGNVFLAAQTISTEAGTANALTTIETTTGMVEIQSVCTCSPHLELGAFTKINAGFRIVGVAGFSFLEIGDNVTLISQAGSVNLVDNSASDLTIGDNVNIAAFVPAAGEKFVPDQVFSLSLILKNYGGIQITQVGTGGITIGDNDTFLAVNANVVVNASGKASNITLGDSDSLGAQGGEIDLQSAGNISAGSTLLLASSAGCGGTCGGRIALATGVGSGFIRVAGPNEPQLTQAAFDNNGVDASLVAPAVGNVTVIPDEGSANLGGASVGGGAFNLSVGSRRDTSAATSINLEGGTINGSYNFTTTPIGFQQSSAPDAQMLVDTGDCGDEF